MCHHRTLLAVPFLVTVLCPAAAPAAPSAAVRAACAGDARRLCGSVFADRKARRACMKEHRAEWSNGCKAAVAKQRDRVGEKKAGAAARMPVVQATRDVPPSSMANAIRQRGCATASGVRNSSRTTTAIGPESTL